MFIWTFQEYDCIDQCLLSKICKSFSSISDIASRPPLCQEGQSKRTSNFCLFFLFFSSFSLLNSIFPPFSQGRGPLFPSLRLAIILISHIFGISVTEHVHKSSLFIKRSVYPYCSEELIFLWWFYYVGGVKFELFFSFFWIEGKKCLTRVMFID